MQTIKKTNGLTQYSKQVTGGQQVLQGNIFDRKNTSRLLSAYSRKDSADQDRIIYKLDGALLSPVVCF